MSLLMIASAAPSAQGGAGSDLPDLETLYGVRWTHVWPTRVSGALTSVTVNNDSQLAAAMALDNRDIFLADGTSYGTIALAGSNNLLRVGGGVSINDVEASVSDPPNVVELKFIVPRDPTSGIKYLNFGNEYDRTATNILLNAIRMDNVASGAETGCTFHADNSAIINSHLNSQTYGMHNDSGPAGYPTNLTLYNNIIESGNYAAAPQSAWRSTGHERCAIVRCRFVKHNIGLGVRSISLSDFHFSHNQVEIGIEATGNNAGCTIRFSTADSPPNIQVYGTNWENNDVYNDSGGPIQFEYVSGGGAGLVSNNRYFGSGSWPSTNNTIVNDGTNTVAAYTTPPAWSFA